MRKNLLALQILVALLVVAALGATTAGAASVRTLKPHLLSSKVAWVGVVDGSTLAYGSSTTGSAAEVLGDRGAARAVAAPDGCTGTAAGAGHLLFGCRLSDNNQASAYRAVVAGPDGKTQASIDYTLPNGGGDASSPGLPEAIGTQWLHLRASCYHCNIWTVDVNWHTGEIRQPAAATLGGSFEDLDAPGLLSPLCAPLKQNLAPQDAEQNWPEVLGVQFSRKWVLQGVVDPKTDAFPPIGYQLRHCGTSKVYKMPAGSQPLALAGGFVVLGGRSLGLLRLRDMKAFKLPGVRLGAVAPDVAATAHRLLIADDATGSGALWSVMLPQR